MTTDTMQPICSGIGWPAAFMLEPRALKQIPMPALLKPILPMMPASVTMVISGLPPGCRILKLLEDRHCCGVPQNHPLAEKPIITAEDLTGQRIVMYNRSITRADDQLRDYLLRHVADIDIIGIDAYSRSLPLKCELASQIMIYYSMYWENFDPLVKVPLSKEMDFPIDIGLGDKMDSSPAVEKCIVVAKETFPAG